MTDQASGSVDKERNSSRPLRNLRLSSASFLPSSSLGSIDSRRISVKGRWHALHSVLRLRGSSVPPMVRGKIWCTSLIHPGRDERSVPQLRQVYESLSSTIPRMRAHVDIRNLAVDSGNSESTPSMMPSAQCMRPHARCCLTLRCSRPQ